jgi:glycosyltransferase involved in cell wall biosynthesis
MIIVDDRSTDNSLAIARAYEKKDKRIKVYVNKKNLGDYPNRNMAASYAKGKYIKYLDADDLIYPHGLEIFVKTMEQFPEAALGISQKVTEDNIPYPFIMEPHVSFERQFLGRGVLDVGPTGTIIRKDIFNQMGGFSGARHIGDNELWLKLSAVHPVVKIYPGLIFWRKHEGQEIVREYKNPEVLAIRFNHALDVINGEKCPLREDQKDKARLKQYKRHSKNILNLAFRKFKIKAAIEIYKNSNLSLLKLFYAFK